ncbi:MAG TPA: penicillin-insensitive murein endopeptidase [Polyangiaceae bacterium]|nr:penicillin-insensitive murein endopeptidase [Polyangiaceae bacterium]
MASGCVSAPSPLAPGLFGAVGAPHSGVQTDGTELPAAGKGYVRYRPKGANHYGRSRLVDALEAVSAEMLKDDPLTPPLVVGDLSARQGGKIPGHQSHRTGRDVDLLFYYVTPRGARVPAPGFIRVESDGLALVPDTGELLRFDVEHEWRLVRALLTSREIGVQFMFVSRTVEALLIDYALARGEPLELVLQAESVLLEPGDSMPHDDHVHLRIACTADEALAGCLGGGPHWEWLAPLPTPAELDDTLLALVAAEPPLDPVEPTAGLGDFPGTLSTAVSGAAGE